MAKGNQDMPTDYKTVIPDDGQGQGINKRMRRSKIPRQLLTTLWHSSMQG
jgi:hypothetical protein